MSVDTHRILMGACGWKHKAWLDDFYSDDLPEDWYLGFYSNEFPVVYVPAADWVNEDDLSSWIEDVSATFRFILEIPSDILNNEQDYLNQLEKAQGLGELCLGLVFTLNERINDNLTLFESKIKAAQAITEVCIDKGDILLSNELKQCLIKANVSEVWHGDSEMNDSFHRGALALSFITDKDIDMLSLRKVIEGCLQASNDNCTSVLCLQGEPPSLDLLRKADVILNLL